MDRQRIDMDLINKAKAGYERAYEALFDHYFQYVHRCIYSLIKNETDIEDLVMITFEKAFKNLYKYQPLFLFSTWLSKIARTTALEFIRYKKRNMRNTNLELDLSKAYSLANYKNPETIIIDNENLMILKFKINQLSELRKNTIIMRTMGMKCREIALETGVEVNTVTERLYNIKQKLAV